MCNFDVRILECGSELSDEVARKLGPGVAKRAPRRMRFGVATSVNSELRHLECQLCFHRWFESSDFEEESFCPGCRYQFGGAINPIVLDS